MILLTETLAIREAFITTIKGNPSNIIIKSDSQLQAISKIAKDIVLLASIVRNAKFDYCNRYVNKVANMIARNTHMCNTQTIVIYQ